MLDVIMVLLMIGMPVLMMGLATWSSSVVDEGSVNK
jgi:hypothetical protein